MYATGRSRAIAAEHSTPRLPAHIRLRFDPVRQKNVLLAPEKLLWPDDIAIAILGLCNGERSVGAIADALADEYSAPRDVILKDVLEFVQEWSDNLLLKI